MTTETTHQTIVKLCTILLMDNPKLLVSESIQKVSGLSEKYASYLKHNLFSDEAYEVAKELIRRQGEPRHPDTTGGNQ